MAQPVLPAPPALIPPCPGLPAPWDQKGPQAPKETKVQPVQSRDPQAKRAPQAPQDPAAQPVPMERSAPRAIPGTLDPRDRRDYRASQESRASLAPRAYPDPQAPMALLEAWAQLVQLARPERIARSPGPQVRRATLVPPVLTAHQAQPGQPELRAAPASQEPLAPLATSAQRAPKATPAPQDPKAPQEQ